MTVAAKKLEAQIVCKDDIGLPQSHLAAPNVRPSETILLRSASQAKLFNLLVKNDRYLARPTAGHERISFGCLLERKSVCNEFFGIDLPAHNTLDEIFHKPDTGNPGSIDRFLVMNHVGTRTQAQCPTFANEGNPTPFACSLNRGEAALVAPACVQGPFYTIPIRQASNLPDVFGARFKHVIGQTELLRNLQAFVNGIDSRTGNSGIAYRRCRDSFGWDTPWPPASFLPRAIDASPLTPELADASLRLAKCLPAPSALGERARA
jgi:hypothetical protein